MPDIASLAQHARGEHRDSPAKGCPACDAVRTAERSEAGAQRAEKGRKRPPSAKKQGRCEHCGVPTAGGRFAPGHDAKLKSRLISQAYGGSADAIAELILRDWLRLIKSHSFDPRLVKVAEMTAWSRGYKLVEERTALRMAAG